MTVQLINIGNVANDGTGDDLREAFIKVNQNFEELDLRDDEQTTASNLGLIGEGLFVRRNVYDLEFKKISAGSNVTLTADDNKIVIAADSGVSDLTINSDIGSVVLDNSATLSISGGTDIRTSITDGVLTVAYIGLSDLASDPSPQLSADLDAQSQNLLNVGTISSSGINGPLTGNVTGNLLGDVIGTHTGNVIGSVFGDVIGSVFGDDSTLIIDGVNNTLVGNLTGDVTGNLLGNLLGDTEIRSSANIVLYPTDNIWISQGTKLIFEGTVPDSFEARLQATTVTADRDIILPDEDGTIATREWISLQQSDLGAIIPSVSNIFEYFIYNTDVDLGSIVTPNAVTFDLGSL